MTPGDTWQARALRECASRIGKRWLRGRVYAVEGSKRACPGRSAKREGGTAMSAAMFPWWGKPSGRPHRNVRVVFGPPSWTLLFLDELERNGRAVRDVLPRWRGYVHYGMDFGPYEDLFRHRLGRGMEFVAGESPAPDDVTLNAFGERVTDNDLRQAVAAAAFEQGCEIVSHKITPEFPRAEESRGRHVWHCAFRGTPPDLEALAVSLDCALTRESPSYTAHREGTIRPPHVLLIPRR